MSRLTWDGTAESVSRDQIFRRECGQGNILCACSDDHEQDWQPYSVDPYPCYMCDHTHIHTYKVVPVTGAAILQVTVDQLMCASLFPHPLKGMKWL